MRLLAQPMGSQLSVSFMHLASLSQFEHTETSHYNYIVQMRGLNYFQASRTLSLKEILHVLPMFAWISCGCSSFVSPLLSLALARELKGAVLWLLTAAEQSGWVNLQSRDFPKRVDEVTQCREGFACLRN